MAELLNELRIDKPNWSEAMNTLDKDKLVLEELKAQNIDVLTDRGKLAIHELAGMNEGAAIFLFLSLNSRIRELEHAIGTCKPGTTIH